ncbi:MAG: alpha/beta hydrolase, partial [Candidatus Obscuribacterales bacterium]|nr:alpha/beta hydrolase [Candidatus Obscuribacterales bacterium]
IGSDRAQNLTKSYKFTARLVFALAIALLSLLFAPHSIAAGKKTIWNVPVLFVTDRSPQKTTFGPRRVLEKNTVARVNSGIVELSVERYKNAPLADWQKSPANTVIPKEKPTKITEFKGLTTYDLHDEFDAALKEALKRSPQKEVFIFVHGFNNSFDVAATNAAHLALSTGCPVILYSWPSAAKVFRYSLDECNNEWSQEHFNQFLEQMLVTKEATGAKFTIVAHSMGNRLFVRAIPILAGKGLFNDMYMVNPDFDAETFIHYLSRYIPTAGLRTGVKAQLLVSRKDNALSLAECLFGGYTRLGQGIDSTLSALTSPQLFGSVWKKAVPLQAEPQAELPAPDPALISSIHHAFRMIDVTALDYGVIGHKVPHDFISWMHFKNQTPPGFELKTEKEMRANRLSNLFARKSKQYLESPTGEISTVVRVDDNEEKHREKKHSGSI